MGRLIAAEGSASTGWGMADIERSEAAAATAASAPARIGPDAAEPPSPLRGPPPPPPPPPAPPSFGGRGTSGRCSCGASCDSVTASAPESVIEPAFCAHSNWNRDRSCWRSRAVWYRSSRWNASAFKMMRSSESGSSGANSRGRGMAPLLTISSASLPLPLNSGRAHVSSNSTMPAANTSLRQSTGSPRACSGDMYANFPLMTPCSS